MTTFTITPTVTSSLASRVLESVSRYFSRSVVTRESVDQAWIDSGLQRLDTATLKDIGAPAGVIERIASAELREAWKVASALDATRHL
jgi:hypothetical protein